MNYEQERDDAANKMYPPVHPAWDGTENGAFKDGWDSCQALMEKLIPDLRLDKDINSLDVFLFKDKYTALKSAADKLVEALEKWDAICNSKEHSLKFGNGSQLADAYTSNFEAITAYRAEITKIGGEK